MWSMVVPCLAATTGCTVGTWEVANTAVRSVWAPRPAAHVYVSNESPLKLVAPPNPFQRATGTMASNPASSASRATSLTSGQAARMVDTRVATQPLPRLAPKTPSFSRFGPYSGLIRSRASGQAQRGRGPRGGVRHSPHGNVADLLPHGVDLRHHLAVG